MAELTPGQTNEAVQALAEQMETHALTEEVWGEDNPQLTGGEWEQGYWAAIRYAAHRAHSLAREQARSVTAAVPDPRFRDQLAEVLERVVRDRHRPWGDVAWFCEHAVDALMPAIAAEVEARVQAAANQRAAEELRKAADAVALSLPGFIGRIDTADALRDRADALSAPSASTGVQGHANDPHRPADGHTAG